ncbi:hypothetical protein K435DRAFT_969251 [Dendrothele bispora CBS 962.96]|uniref:Uncharacterized protein n=1 Tax=Dendrothele bispora (strain CBS 962.96) TaxID=1314807 RepID=A0A4S8LJN6_DENBC|nr:hypothetical protein K435DRAFT_969251 [Dendrothele bispora CBS 962.96]
MTTEPPLRYRKRTACLLVIYLPTLIIPWVLTCLLNKRPLNASSYYIQDGSLTARQLLSIEEVVGLIKVVNAINGVLVVPITSAILAQAAVVYSQRRKPAQSLNMAQLFALADRGWSDVVIMFTSILGSQVHRSGLLWAGAILTMLSAILQPIQSILITNEPITVMSCLDLPLTGCGIDLSVAVGYDSQPSDMRFVPHNLVVQNVVNALGKLSDLEPQPHLWPDNPYADRDIDGFTTPQNRRIFFWYYGDDDFASRRYFVSALENGTTTGVLRQHAIRFNSSVTCEHIPRSDYPTTCAGVRPMVMELDRPGLKMRVCAPGEIGHYPWTLSRNRQDISEELYLDLEPTDDQVPLADVSNLTMHCTASTTRGYFELGNYRNNYSYGPLIAEWPSPEIMAKEFNDYISERNATQPTVEDDTDLTDAYSDDLPFSRPSIDPFPLPPDTKLNVSGPLMTSAVALFGNSSFLNIASDTVYNMTSKQQLLAMCVYGNIPFTQVMSIIANFEEYCGGVVQLANIVNNTQALHEERAAVQVNGLVGDWTYSIFNNTLYAKEALEMSMYFANEALMMKTVDQTFQLFGRPIYTSGGIQVFKPVVTVAGTIIVTVLVSLQLLGLGIFAWYVYSVPTWTNALDALAIARIGKEMADSDLPPIGPVQKKDQKKLGQAQALIGLTGDVEYENTSAVELKSLVSGKNQSAVKLGLGEKGLITRKMV